MSFESFTYGGEKVGGTGPTHQTEVLDSYMFVTTQDDAEFVVRFSVYVTPSGNATTDYNALNAACQAVEDALRMRYQRLEVDWGGANPVEVFDPDVNAGTFPSSGFDQEPHLEKIRDFPNTGEARGYEYRVRLSKYPNYTDAYGAANGRRQVDVKAYYDTDQRFIVVMSGEWTQVPSTLARAKFLSIFDGNTGYASYRLGLIDSTVAGLANATWSLTRREESDPNSLSTLRFTREYQQHVNGRRGASVEVFFQEPNLRLVTIRGTYLRTVTGTNYGTANGSLANYADAVNGGIAFAVTQLAALTAAQGGALTVGHDCELLREPFVTTNEQDDRTEYTLVYRELNQQQSSASGAFLDDPNIVGDSMIFGVKFNELNDSPEPTAAASIPGPAGSQSAPGGGTSAGGVPSTVSPPASVVSATNPNTTGGGNTGSTSVVKPVDLFVHYEAFFKKSIALNLYDYWNNNVLGLLVTTLNAQFHFTAAELVDCSMKADTTRSAVSADLHIRAYPGPVILFQFTLGLFNDLGIRVDPAFTGTPHEYLVQQALPKSTMSRRVEAVYLAGSGFSLDKYLTPSALSGWVKLSDAKPNTVTRVLGVPAQHVPTTSLTYAILEENLIWVARNVAQGSAGGGNPSDRIATLSGLGVNPPPVPVPVATGQGG